jgi:hypothetical protein
MNLCSIMTTVRIGIPPEDGCQVSSLFDYSPLKL